MVKAVDDGLSYRKAEKRFNISSSVIQRYRKFNKIGRPGRPVVIRADADTMSVKRLVTCGISYGLY